MDISCRVITAFRYVIWRRYSFLFKYSRFFSLNYRCSVIEKTLLYVLLRNNTIYEIVPFLGTFWNEVGDEIMSWNLKRALQGMSFLSYFRFCIFCSLNYCATVEARKSVWRSFLTKIILVAREKKLALSFMYLYIY